MTSNPSSKTNPNDFSYAGEELDLFSHAVNWKRYWASKIRPFLGNEVLEVGAGTGTNTPLLASSLQQRWVCLEPDAGLAERLRYELSKLSPRPEKLEVMVGTTESISAEARFDTLLYIDVLEHIEADQKEMDRAFNLLNPGGHIVVLSPSYQFLYSPFDEGLGHCRRYSRTTLQTASPKGQAPVKLFYLDSVGFAASLANKLLLKQSLPTIAQIQFWDRYLVRGSLVVDPLIGFNFGKTIVGIWKKPA